MTAPALILNLSVCRLAALLAAVLLDLLFGDPKRLHIVILIGTLISALEPPLRRRFTDNPLAAGRWLVVLTLLLTLLPAAAVLYAAYAVSIYLLLALDALLCWQLIAGRELARQSMAVFSFLKSGDLPAARRAVSMIVGRDTDVLDAEGVARAAVESIAENSSDGVIAPLLYITLLGSLGGLCYKAINTLDSMVGYKNERYLLFGRAAAKTDDAANLLPSRLTALLLLVSAFFLGYDARSALKVFLRDRNNHESPNSGQPEAVCAGALHIRLGGPTVYGGVTAYRRYIGDSLRPVMAADIPRVCTLMLLAAALMLALAALFILLAY